jgi:transposase
LSGSLSSLKNLKLSDSEWECSKCGLPSDKEDWTKHYRDINAAVNIRQLKIK